MKKKKAAIWIRVSTEDQAKGDSPKHHEQRARLYAEMKDWEVVTVYHLEGVSGKEVLQHPEAQRMLHDLQLGKFDCLIFSKLARLARNTSELLLMSRKFEESNADMVSLHESIDTSSPAGRFFYTLLAAMAEWEREEIADRVKASVKIRAKMGKSLGGAAPFGYRWVDKKLELQEDEAKVRKLMFDLFLKKKKTLTTADELNSLGYRTRNGSKFTFTTVKRLLRDSIAMGLRRINYTESLGEGKHWKVKDQKEWEYHEVPTIVSKEIWTQANDILDALEKNNTKRTKATVKLFTGFLKCQCGPNLRYRKQTKKYVCPDCRLKIHEEDIATIFREQLKEYVLDEDQVKKHLKDSLIQTKDIEEKLVEYKSSIGESNKRIQSLLQLHAEGQLETTEFKSFYQPHKDKVIELQKKIEELQHSKHSLELNPVSFDESIVEAQDLYENFNSLSNKAKRSIIETITDEIVVGFDEIEIKLKYFSPNHKLVFDHQHMLRGSYSLPT